MHDKTGLQSRPRARGGKRETERERAGFCFFFLLFLPQFQLSLLLPVALSVVGRNAERTVRVGHSQRTKVENACALEFCCRCCVASATASASAAASAVARAMHTHTHTQLEPRCVTFCRLGRDRAASACLCLSPSPSAFASTSLSLFYPPSTPSLPCLRSINLRPFGLHLFAFG